jgi:hypothetical protein
MFRLDEGLKVYLHREAVDFRKYINGLATLLATLPKARRADDYEALLPWRLTPRARILYPSSCRASRGGIARSLKVLARASSVS